MTLKADHIPILELAPHKMIVPQTTGVIRLGLFEMGNQTHFMKDIIEGREPLLFTFMRRAHSDNLEERLFDIGVIVEVSGTNSEKGIELLLQPKCRARRSNFVIGPGGYMVARAVEIIDDKDEKFFIDNKEGRKIVSPGFQETMDGLFFNLRLKTGKLLEKCLEFPDLSDLTALEQVFDMLCNLNTSDAESIDRTIWALIDSVPHITSEKKQHLIETTSLMRRIGGTLGLVEANILIISEALNYNISSVKITRKKKAHSSPNDEANHYVSEIKKKWEKFQEIKDNLNPGAAKAIMEDFDHLKHNQPGQAEWSVNMVHLDCLLDIYSAKATPQEKDTSKVEKKLEESHYGLENVKETIKEYLAVKTLNPKGKAPILCFVGPPGVGKTSITRSVADALNLKYIRLSLGGVRDEADIRGHRRTYIGAIPGKIIQEIRRVDSKNPVFVLDEVDKLTNDFRGDPSSALLEVLDPEQNHSFQDHYVEAPFDLSGVLFLCTANLESGIQPALLDRMNLISISGYTEKEKIQIAKRHLVSKQMEEVGLADKVKIMWPKNNPDEVLEYIIGGYTREAGVRNLEREIHKILSRWGSQYLKLPDTKKPAYLMMDKNLVGQLLKAPIFTHERANETEVGETIGLAWTPTGGSLMYIQAQLTPFIRGEKALSQTGGLQEVFREMNKNALTVAKNLLRGDESVTQKLRDNILHLSSPDGAVPKDGPSAGIAMTVAIYSELTGKRVKPFLAMTGEITVKGRVRAIGGVKEKVLAAHRDGIKEIILPENNERDIEEKVSSDIKKDLKFHFVRDIKEVIDISFPKQS